MDDKEQKKEEPTSNMKTAATHPYESANCFSRAVVGWMSSILQLGSKRPLVKDDIFPVRKEDSMQVLVTKLESEWQQEIKRCLPRGCKPRLWKALVRLFSWKAYTLMLILILCRLLCITALPMLMWFFLLEFEKESQDGYSKTPFLFVTGIAILAFCQIFAKSHAASMAEIWGNQLKVSCIGLVYKKVSMSYIYCLKEFFSARHRELFITPLNGLLNRRPQISARWGGKVGAILASCKLIRII